VTTGVNARSAVAYLTDATHSVERTGVAGGRGGLTVNLPPRSLTTLLVMK
jgi:hypothetical protein